MAGSADAVGFGSGDCACVVFGAGLEKGLEAGAALDVLMRDSDFVGTTTASVGVRATVGVASALVDLLLPKRMYSLGGS
jgi:hypothetical protein